jgi:Fe-S-cluster containining protein
VSVKSLLARVGFALNGEHFEEHVRVPRGAARPRDLLPAAQQLTEAIVSRAVKRAQQGGEAISCRRGCGACCRQPVPVSQTEARHLRDVVARLPEPRRAEVRARFAAARERLEQTGLLQRLRWPDGLNQEQRQQLAVDYFRAQIPCPFLENEACSIYADRPLVCREYLVTTPAANCARPTVEPVVRVRIAGRVSVALGHLEPTTSERGVWWMPLILAPAWADEHPEQPAPQPIFDLLRQLVNWLKQTV